MADEAKGWDPASREAFRAELVAQIPSWYSPWAHLAFPSLVSTAILVGCVLSIHDLRPLQLLTIPIVYVIANAFEWRVHKQLLHRRTPFMEVLYDRHTPMHHRIFLTDDMAMRSNREFRLVLVPAFGLLGVALLLTPFTLGILWLGYHNVAALFLATAMYYAVSYEWLHLSYHLPPDSFIGGLRIIGILRRHHAIHHSPERMQHWNFNVTVPLWDLVKGTTFRG